MMKGLKNHPMVRVMAMRTAVDEEPERMLELNVKDFGRVPVPGSMVALEVTGTIQSVDADGEVELAISSVKPLKKAEPAQKPQADFGQASGKPPMVRMASEPTP